MTPNVESSLAVVFFLSLTGTLSFAIHKISQLRKLRADDFALLDEFRSRNERLMSECERVQVASEARAALDQAEIVTLIGHLDAAGDRLDELNRDLGDANIRFEAALSCHRKAEEENRTLRAELAQLRDDYSQIDNDWTVAIAKQDELKADLDAWRAKGRNWAHLAGVTRDTCERMRAGIVGMLPDDFVPVLSTCKVSCDDHK